MGASFRLDSDLSTNLHLKLILALTLGAASALAEPPIRIKPDLIHQDLASTLGLPVVRSQHQMIFHASEDTYKYSHHPNFATFKDRLYLMWSSGKEGENQNGQRIVCRSTADGTNWTPLATIAEDPDGPGKLHGVAAGFLVRGGKLYAFYSGAFEEQPLHPESTLFARYTTDGVRWSEQIRIAQGFFNQPPRELPGGRVVIGGHSHAPQPRILYTDSSDPLTGWKTASIPDITEFAVRFVEPTSYRRPDGALAMLFRAEADSKWLWASLSRDNGATWTKAERTEIPDAVSKMAAGTLPDGTTYLINNTSQKFGRIPLSILLSRDGITFDRGFAIRTEQTSARFLGRAKGGGYQYPGALVWKGELWVAYSINKEDVAISRIPLDALAPPKQAQALPYHVDPSWPRLPKHWTLDETAGIAVSPQQNVLLFHRGPHPIIEFTPEGEFVRSFGDGIFPRPHGLRFDREGNLWAVDAASHTVVKLDAEGRVRMVLGRRGYAAEAPDRFNQPTDIAFSRDGSMFVTDGYGNSRVVKYTAAGEFIAAWGHKGTGPGEFNLPHAVVIDERDRVLVADRENYRIQVFDTNGTFHEEWTGIGSPWGLALAPDGNLWMADGHNNRILKLNGNGKILGMLSGPGKLPGKLNFAHHIAVAGDGSLYVTEILNWRAQKFVPNGDGTATQ